MSSGDDSSAIVDEQLHIEPGMQVLVSTSAVGHPLELLPPTVEGKLLLVTAETPPSIEQSLRDRDFDLSTVGMIPITGSATDYDGPIWTSEPIVPDDLTGLSMRFTKALDAFDEGSGWVWFDSLDTLATYASHDRVCRFFDHVTHQAADRNLRGVYTIASGVLDDDVEHSFQRSVDRVVDAR